MSDNATAPAPLVLLTRPREASERFAAMLRAEFGPMQIAILPLMEIVPLVTTLDLEDVAALIFTSAAGVEVFSDLTGDRSLPAWCVGERTAQAAREAGLKAMSAGGDAAALVALMADARPLGRLLHLHGAHTRGDVAEGLNKAGLRAEGRAIYDQRRISPGPAFTAALAHDGPIVVPLFSPRSARLFAEAADPVGANLRPVTISAAARDALPDRLARTATLAAAPDAEAMMQAVGALISPQTPA
jgi:uroporphyrinogen-III synthase